MESGVILWMIEIFVQSIKYFCFQFWKKSFNLSLYMKFLLLYKVKRTMTNLQKYFHPFSLDQLLFAHVQCREPQEVSKRFQLLIKKTTGLCSTRCYYSLGQNIDLFLASTCIACGQSDPSESSGSVSRRFHLFIHLLNQRHLKLISPTNSPAG